MLRCACRCVQAGRARCSCGAPPGGQQQAGEHPDTGGHTEGQQGPFTHRLFDAGPQAAVEFIEQLLQLLLQRTDAIGQLAGLAGGHLKQLAELVLHPGGSSAGLLGDHGHHIIETAAGGLKGFAGHLGPFALDGGQQGLKPLTEAVVVDGGRIRFHGAQGLAWLHTS